MPGSGSGTRKIQSWIRIRNKSVLICNTGYYGFYYAEFLFYNFRFPHLNRQKSTFKNAVISFRHAVAELHSHLFSRFFGYFTKYLCKRSSRRQYLKILTQTLWALGDYEKKGSLGKKMMIIVFYFVMLSSSSVSVQYRTCI